MMESRRRKVLLFSFLFSFLSATLFAAPGYSGESIFTSYYEGPFLQCKTTKKPIGADGNCVVLMNVEDAKKRCKITGGAGGSGWSCKKSGEAVAKSKAK